MAALSYAERLTLSQRIEKLARMTEARGATRAEALAAHAKILVLKARLYPKSQGLYVEGWPGEVHCEHRTWYRFGIHKICAECRLTFQ